MEIPTPRARYLGPADRSLLAGFTCSTGAGYEVDVERFVQEELIDQHLWRASHTGHVAIGLEIPDRGLVAVTSHEEDLTRISGTDLTSTLWEVGAVSVELQGAILPDVQPLDPDGKPVTLGRYMAEVALSDIVRRNRAPIVRAVVANDNRRSLALCDRVGLVNVKDDRPCGFVQRWGRMVSPPTRRSPT